MAATMGEPAFQWGARHPIGERDRDKHAGLARQHSFQPRACRRAMYCRLPSDPHGLRIAIETTAAKARVRLTIAARVDSLALTKRLGEVIQQGSKGIYKITLDPELNDTADYLHATTHWHIDGAQDTVPTLTSLLTARVLSQVGGQTEFANTYAAYESLPEDLKAQADGLRVTHSQEYIQRAMYANPTDAQLARWREHPEQSHPMVWTHRSGRKSLLLGLTAGRVEGKPSG